MKNAVTQYTADSNDHSPLESPEFGREVQLPLPTVVVSVLSEALVALLVVVETELVVFSVSELLMPVVVNSAESTISTTTT